MASTRGGVHSTSEGGRAMEHQDSYLQTLFEFPGITDIRFVRAEGLAMGEVHRARAIAAAEPDIRALVTEAANEPRAARAA